MTHASKRAIFYKELRFYPKVLTNMTCDTHCSTEVSKLKCTLDLGLVADRTGSIKWRNVPKLKAALQLLVQRFDISADKTHVSYLTFATRSKLHNKFNNAAYHSQGAIVALLSRSIRKLRSPTRLDRAMKAANEQMFTLKNGLRPGVGKALVLYTDGKTLPTSKDISGHVAALKVTPLVVADKWSLRILYSYRRLRPPSPPLPTLFNI